MVGVVAEAVVADKAIVETDVPGDGRISNIGGNRPEPAGRRRRKRGDINGRVHAALVCQAGQLLDVGQAPTRLGFRPRQRLLMGVGGRGATAGASAPASNK
jgi:hypothetical protein